MLITRIITGISVVFLVLLHAAINFVGAIQAFGAITMSTIAVAVMITASSSIFLLLTFDIWSALTPRVNFFLRAALRCFWAIAILCDAYSTFVGVANISHSFVPVTLVTQLMLAFVLLSFPVIAGYLLNHYLLYRIDFAFGEASNNGQPARSGLNHNLNEMSSHTEDEIERWRKVANSADSKVYREHLARFPGGVTADAARTRLASLKAGALSESELFAQKRQADLIGAPTSTPEVACSVFAPSRLRCWKSALIQVFLHRRDDNKGVERLAAQIDPARGRQLTQDLDVEIKKGQEVVIVLSAGEFLLSRQTARLQKISWTGHPISVNYIVRAPFGLFDRTLLPHVTLLVDGKAIGRISFKVQVSWFAGDAERAFSGEARRYNRAFLSYSSEDRGEVLKRAQAIRASGIDCFQDVLNLQPGERWSTRLREEMKKADVFFLFWSQSAKRSRWVMREARFALGLQKKSPSSLPDIIPIILEFPPPSPPRSLRHLHFNDPISTPIMLYSKQ